MAYNEEDRKFADRYIDHVKRIMGPRVLETTRFTLDVEEAADLTTIGDARVRLAVRVRRPKYNKPQYRNQITLRASAKLGPSELEKVISGYGDYMFYGFAEDDTTDQLAYWQVIDLKNLRLYLHRCFQEANTKNVKYGYIASQNGDSFLWVDVSKAPVGANLVVDRKNVASAINTSQYNAKRDLEMMFSGKDDQFRRLRRVAERLGAHVLFEQSAGALALQLGRQLQPELRQSTLYNMVFDSLNKPLLAVESISLYEFSDAETEIPKAVLAMESEVRERVFRALAIPMLRIDGFEVPMLASSDREVWEYLAEDAIANALASRDDAPLTGTDLQRITAGAGASASRGCAVKLRIAEDRRYYRGYQLFVNGEQRWFDVGILLFGRSDPFTHMIRDEPLVAEGHPGFDARELRVYTMQDAESGVVSAGAACWFFDGSVVSGFAHVSELQPIFLTIDQMRLAEGLACARMYQRCIQVRHQNAIPDNAERVAERISDFERNSAKMHRCRSTEEYREYSQVYTS